MTIFITLVGLFLPPAGILLCTFFDLAKPGEVPVSSLCLLASVTGVVGGFALGALGGLG